LWSGRNAGITAGTSVFALGRQLLNVSCVLCFFAYLRCKLDNINISRLEFGVGNQIVGSDEERALPKAVETCFLQTTTLLCCRHLAENVRQRLQGKVGVLAEVRQDIVIRVFGWC